MLVLEAAPLGDLHELVQSRRRLGGVPLAERFICSLFTQIASAVVHLHAHGVVHRDLKSLNVVLFAEADAVATARGILRREEDAMWQDVGSSGETYRSVPIGAIRAKICDLGVSRARSNDTVYLQTFCGTPAYLAPEIVGSRPYTEGADVWSLGVLLYELAALSLPFFGRSVREVSDLIARGKFAPLPPTYSAGLVGLVSAMLQLDLDRRPDAQRVLEWAKGLELDRAAQAAPSEAAPAPGDHSLGGEPTAQTAREAVSSTDSPSTDVNRRDRHDGRALRGKGRCDMAAQGHGAPREDAKHRETAPPREGKFERYRREFEERQRCAAVERNATEGVTGGTADILVMEEAPRAEEAARAPPPRIDRQSEAEPPADASPGTGQALDSAREPSVSAVSARSERLVQRRRERDASLSSCGSCQTPTCESSRPPSTPGIMITESADRWPEQQVQAYVLAQQMLALHANSRCQQRPIRAAPSPQQYSHPDPVFSRPGSARPSRPGSARPGSARGRLGVAGDGFDLISGAPLRRGRRGGKEQ